MLQKQIRNVFCSVFAFLFSKCYNSKASCIMVIIIIIIIYVPLWKSYCLSVKKQTFAALHLYTLQRVSRENLYTFRCNPTTSKWDMNNNMNTWCIRSKNCWIIIPSIIFTPVQPSHGSPIHNRNNVPYERKNLKQSRWFSMCSFVMQRKKN